MPRFPMQFAKKTWLTVVPFCKLLVFLAVANEINFLILDGGLDTCDWLLRSGYLRSSLSDGGGSGFQWTSSRCSTKVYSADEHERGSNLTQLPDDHIKFDSSSIDSLFLWKPFMDDSKPFAKPISGLGSWEPDVLVMGGGMWSFLSSEGKERNYQDFLENLGNFAEYTLKNLYKTKVIWKTSPFYPRSAKFVHVPKNMDYELLNQGLEGYNQGAITAITDVPGQMIKFWTSDIYLIKSMVANHRYVFHNWKHFSNETLHHELQV
ncbi:unnamed protein product [Notodromas monacha]|uniref:Uncharacterized protein n=1 Tax=Notodromas monacha TaxID=399045 RepID=A0A7R9G890_9CRUS|nr:unnamed protein product [Notodromas monacha]CAG0913029.1 unnamed protein product [Notodromas monacha]